MVLIPVSSFGVNEAGTYKQFMSAHMAGLTQLDMKGFVDLMIQFPDWVLITDSKNSLRDVLPIICSYLNESGISCQNRVIPQLYKFRDLEVVKNWGSQRQS
ncbi:hypothetical protein P9112_001622 [Eukaryota sp. TZLM1-RC]